MRAQTEALDLMVARSLRQMIRAGHRYAQVPAELAPPVVPSPDAVDLHDVCLDGVDEHGAGWVCLLPAGHAGDHPLPPPTERAARAAALADQVDPVARINRRWAHALAELDPGVDAGEAVADFLDDLAGMPPA